MKRFLRSMLCVVLLLASVCVFASAYTRWGHRLYGTKTFVPHEDFGSTSVQQMNDMMYKWNVQMDESYLKRDSTNRHSRTDYPVQDGVNEVFRVNTGKADYLQETRRFQTTGILLEADVNVNMHYRWTNSAQPYAYDFKSVFLHEMGHVCGLSHSEYESAVMYESIGTNTDKSNLTQDDIDGIKDIYF